MANKKREHTFSEVTPRGVAVYPHLDAPDTKFDAAGVYTLKLNLPAEEAEPIIEKLEQLREEFREKVKEQANGKKVKDADLPVSENEDGTFTFSFKMKASGEKDGRKWTRKPAIFDASGIPVKAGVKVGGGSIVRVAFEASAFYTALVGLGVTLRLNAVQIIELKSWGERSATQFGFEQEDGFSFEDLPEEQDEETEDGTEPVGTEETPDF